MWPHFHCGEWLHCKKLETEIKGRINLIIKGGVLLLEHTSFSNAVTMSSSFSMQAYISGVNPWGERQDES